MVWEVDIVVSVNRLLNFAEFWITKCRKFVKFPFGQCHLVFVLHKSFLWFENQESWLTLGVFIKLWNCQTKLNVNFTYFLRSIFQIILIRLNVVVNGSKKRFLCSSWDFGSYEISGLKSSQQLSGYRRMSLHLSLIIVWFVGGCRRSEV